MRQTSQLPPTTGITADVTAGPRPAVTADRGRRYSGAARWCRQSCRRHGRRRSQPRTMDLFRRRFRSTIGHSGATETTLRNPQRRVKRTREAVYQPKPTIQADRGTTPPHLRPGGHALTQVSAGASDQVALFHAGVYHTSAQSTTMPALRTVESQLPPVATTDAWAQRPRSSLTPNDRTGPRSTTACRRQAEHPHPQASPSTAAAQRPP